MIAAKSRATLNTLVAAYLAKGGIVTKCPTTRPAYSRRNGHVTCFAQIVR